MNLQERGIQHKLKILRHAEQTGNVVKTCCYFDIGRQGALVDHQLR